LPERLQWNLRRSSKRGMDSKKNERLSGPVIDASGQSTRPAVLDF